MLHFRRAGVQTSESISEKIVPISLKSIMSCLNNVKCQMSSVKCQASCIKEVSVGWADWNAHCALHRSEFLRRGFRYSSGGFYHCKELCNTPTSPHHQLARLQVCGVKPKKETKVHNRSVSSWEWRGCVTFAPTNKTHTLGRLVSALIVWYSYGKSGHALPEALTLWKGSSEKTFSNTERYLLRKASQSTISGSHNDCSENFSGVTLPSIERGQGQKPLFSVHFFGQSLFPKNRRFKICNTELGV